VWRSFKQIRATSFGLIEQLLGPQKLKPKRRENFWPASPHREAPFLSLRRNCHRPVSEAFPELLPNRYINCPSFSSVLRLNCHSQDSQQPTGLTQVKREKKANRDRYAEIPLPSHARARETCVSRVRPSPLNPAAAAAPHPGRRRRSSPRPPPRRLSPSYSSSPSPQQSVPSRNPSLILPNRRR
jgi:hypothetical protein